MTKSICSNVHSLIIIFLFSLAFYNDSYAINIPRYEIPTGVTLISTNDYEINESARRNKDEQQMMHKSNIWVRHLSHLEIDKRKSDHDEWMLWVLTQREGEGQRGFINYNKTGLDGVQVIFYFDEKKELVIKPIKDDEELILSDKQTETIKSIASENTYFKSIIELVSLKDYPIKEEFVLDPELIKKYLSGNSGTIKLNSIKHMWGKDIAEFKVSTSYENGECKYNFWVLKDTGQPVNFTTECFTRVKPDDVSFHRIEYVSRAYSYSDLPISTISPKPIPALQPNGTVEGIEFSDYTNQLLLLTKEHKSSNTWLTFWDINQRKALYTARQGGKKLHLTDNGQKAYNIDYNTRSQSGWVIVDNKYVKFGGIKPDFEFDRGIIDSTLMGIYPITLNEKNEIEVWNTGYARLAYRTKLKHSSPELLSVSEDGRLVTADSSGNHYLHKIAIDVSHCNTDIYTSYCENPEISLQESSDLIHIDTGIAKRRPNKEKSRLASIEIHPKKNLMSYCTVHPSTCGVVNLDNNGSNFEFEGGFKYTDNIHFTDDSKIVTHTAIYDLTGKTLSKTLSKEFITSYGSTISEKFKLIFHNQPNFDHITDHEIAIQSTTDGSVIDSIQRQVYPVNSLSIGDENTLIFSSRSYNKGKASILSLNSLELQSLSFPIAVYDIEFKNGWMYAKSDTGSFITSMKSPDKPVILNFHIGDYAFLDKYFIYTKDNTIYQYSLDSGETIKLHTFDSPVHEFEVFNETGSELVARLNKGMFSLPHLNRTLDLPFSGANAKKSLHYSESSKTFFVSGLFGFSKSFNQQMNTIAQFSTEGDSISEMEPDWDSHNIISTSDNGQLWSGNYDGEITIRDIKSGLIIENIEAHNGEITDIKQLDHNKMVTASSDGTIKMWRLDHPNGKFKNGAFGLIYNLFIKNDIGKRAPKLISTIVVDKHDEFIMNSPDGYYWSTPKALHNASFINDDESFDYSQYDFWLNRPDIILDRTEKGSEKSIKLWKKMVDFRQSRQPDKPRQLPFDLKAPEFTLTGPDNIVTDTQVKLTYNIKETDDDEFKLHVLINQIPVFGTHGKPVDNNNGDLTLDLTSGVNKIKAYIETKNGAQSESRFLTYNKPTPDKKPDLYVLSIGVSDYDRDEIDLGYASKDASDIEQLLRKSQQYSKVHTKLLSNKAVTVDAITDAKEFLMQSKAIDSVVVFFAGHGFLDKSNNYYFGTSNIDPYNPQSKGLAYNQITDLLDGIPSRSKLLMLDTCHSGEVVEMANNTSLPEGVKARGIIINKVPRQENDQGLSFELLQKTFVDLRASTGTIVISASGGQEFALERGNLQNGVFTSTVIKGLGEMAADKNKDTRVSISELREYTYREVSRLTNGKQKPTTRNNNLDIDFAIY